MHIYIFNLGIVALFCLLLFVCAAGRVNQEFRAAQELGLPYPILWVAEYFVLDGEEILWGRYYREAGFYTHSILWLFIIATVRVLFPLLLICLSPSCSSCFCCAFDRILSLRYPSSFSSRAPFLLRIRSDPRPRSISLSLDLSYFLSSFSNSFFLHLCFFLLFRSRARVARFVADVRFC